MTTGKSYWREKIKIILSQFSLEEISQKSHQLSLKILHHLSAHLESLSDEGEKKCFIVGGFAPFNDEPQWNLQLTKFENRFAFPRSLPGEKMAFYKARPQDLIIARDFGVSMSVPREGAEEVIPDLIFVPGLGFSRKGDRLGRGKGFYDRYLMNYRGRKWGLCFSEQVLSDFPSDRHDQKVDIIITEKEIINVNEVLPSAG